MSLRLGGKGAGHPTLAHPLKFCKVDGRLCWLGVQYGFSGAGLQFLGLGREGGEYCGVGVVR